MSGKELRIKRIVSPVDGRTVIFPLDHGVSCGPIQGLECVEDTVEKGIRGGADALVLHKGMLRCLEPSGRTASGNDNASLRKHEYGTLAGSQSPCRQRGGGTPARCGCGFRTLNFGDTFEPEMLKDLGAVGRACSEWQMPLLVMAYVRADVKESSPSAADAAHAARVAAELGADVVKMPFPGDYDLLGGITSSLSIPIVIAGGIPRRIDQTLERVENCLKAGARGVATGRGIFQQDDPEAVLRAICDIVHRGIPRGNSSNVSRRDRSAEIENRLPGHRL